MLDAALEYKKELNQGNEVSISVAAGGIGQIWL
jgi:hypothetical protein